MKQTRYLYVSYASIEAEFALQLAADLRNGGVQAWLDRLQLPGTMDWQSRALQAFERASGLLVIISPEWFTSQYCQREHKAALERGIPVFAVSLGVMAEDDYPRSIDLQQVIDFSEWRSERVYRERFRRLMTALRQAAPDWIVKPPSDEIRYLIQTVARMEVAQGSLEYMTMANQTWHLSSEQPARSAPRLAPYWGITGRLVALDKVRHAATAEPRWRRTYIPSLKAALAKRPHAILLGTPGSGKTASLQRLTLDGARARLSDPTLPISVYVNLAHWQEGQDFETFLSSRAPMLPDLVQMAAKGAAALYIDGLNEITQHVEARIHQIRVWLSSATAPQRVVFACRTRSYDQSLNLDLPTLEIEPLDDETICRLIQAYVGDESAAHAIHRICAPESSHPLDAQTRELARNPMLLTGLVFLYKSAPDGELPMTLGNLLKRWMATQWIWKRMTHMPAWMPFREVEAGLARLAFTMVERNLPTGLSYGDALNLLNDDKLLRAAQNAGLVELEADVVAFRQPLLAEYFAAVGAARLPLADRLEPPRFNQWGERVASRWDTVLLILAGLLPNADDIVSEIGQTDPFLAAQILSGGVESSAEARERAIRILIEITHFVTGEGRLAAVRSLADLGHPDTLHALLDVMRSGTWQVRQAANWLLHRLPLPVPPALLEAVRDWNWSMDERVATALRDSSVDALPLLLEVLRDEHWSRRRGAAWALGEIGDAAAVPGLVEALADDESQVRCEAARALRLIIDLDSMPMLIDALRDSDGQARKAALDAVVAFKAAALPGLLGLLHDASTGVRRSSLEALAQIGDPSATSQIMPLLRDANVEIRSAAAQTLGSIRSADAVPALTAALQDTSSLPNKGQRVRDYVIQALRAIGGHQAQAALDRLPPPAEPPPARPEPQKGSAFTARGRLPGAKDAKQQLERTPEVLEALYDPDWRMRKAAVEALRGADPQVKVPALLQALHDEDAQVRFAAVQALEGAHSDEVIWRLSEALQDVDHLVADAAAAALASVGARAVPDLINGLKHSSANVRGRAVEALGQIGESAAVMALKALLNDTTLPQWETESIADKVVKALEQIGSDEALQTLDDWRGSRPAHEAAHPPQAPALPALAPDVDENGDLETKEAAPTAIDDGLLPYQDVDSALSPWVAGNDDLPLVDQFLPDEPFIQDITRQQLAGMLQNLHSQDWRTRQEAAKELRSHTRQLGGIADEAFARHLLVGLDDPEHLVRWSVTEALAWVHHPLVPPALAHMLRDSSWTVRLAALRALYEHDDALVAEEVIAALRDEHPAVREAAAEVLGKLGGEESAPALIDALNDREGFVRRAAADALGALQSESAVPALLGALKDTDYQVRYAAVESLGKIGDPSVVRDLVMLLKETNAPLWAEGRSLSHVALQALARIGSPEAKRAIELWKKHVHAKAAQK
jgi:HEAT repeat protein